MDTPYYYSRNGKKIGPVSFSELKEYVATGALSPEELVWQSGQSEWAPAASIAGLFPSGGAVAREAALSNPGSPARPVGPVSDGPVTPADRWAAAKQTGQIWLGRSLTELKKTAKATAAQGMRSSGLAWSHWQARGLRRRVDAALLTLGEKLQQAELGDPNLRTQLTQVEERIRSVRAARGSTRLLETERRGLQIRLAEPYLKEPATSAAVNEHRQLLAAREALDEHLDQLARRRTELLPADRVDRRRVVFGGLVVFLLLTGAIWGMASRNPVSETGTPPDQTNSPDKDDAPFTGTGPSVPSVPNDPGTPPPVTVSQPQSCSICFGTGKVDCSACFGSGRKTCFQCNGSGRVAGTNFQQLVCQNCNGTGKQQCFSCQYGKIPCYSCGGLGRK